MKFSGLKDVLKKFDNRGWEGSFTSGCWKIANGGYDRWFELYYKGQPVAQCVAGELSCNTSLISDADKEVLISKVLEVYDDLKLNEMDVPSTREILVTNIQWDAPKSAKLPKRVVVDINEDNVDLLEDIEGYADNLCDYLSDEHGYCIKGFCVEVIEKKPTLDNVIKSCEELSKGSMRSGEQHDVNRDER